MINRIPKRLIPAPIKKPTMSAPPAHMSAHSRVTTNVVKPSTLLKPQSTSAAQLKKKPVAPTANRPQTVPPVLQAKNVKSPSVNRSHPGKRAVAVVQRAQDDRSPGARALDIALREPAFRQQLTLSTVGALRGVNRETKALVDTKIANPGNWAVLHRLHTHSFTKFVETSLPAEDRECARRAYEATYSKYDPSKYGKKHKWLSNLKWLRDVNRRFSHIAVTDLPLSEGNVKRQSESALPPYGKRDDFSAYARELAYALLHSYRTQGPQQNFTYNRMMVQSLHKPVNPIELNSKQKYVLRSVLGNTRVSLDEVLVTFSELGVPVNPEELVQAERRVESISYDKQIVKLKEYIGTQLNAKHREWPHTQIRDDPQQWPRAFLRRALQAMLGPYVRVGNQEMKMWRVRLHEWYEAGLLKLS